MIESDRSDERKQRRENKRSRREERAREPALKVDDFGSPPMLTMDAQVEVTAAARRESCGKDD